MMLRWLAVYLASLLSVQLVAAQSSAPAKTANPFEQALIDSEKSLIEAEKKGGAEFFQRLLASDFSRVGVDGQLQDRADAIDDWADGGIEIKPYDINVISASDAGAIVTYDAVVQVPPEEDQDPPPRYQHISSVWILQDGQWRLKFQQATATHWGDW